MAKSWKKLLPNDARTASEPDLEQSFKDLLQIDDTLQALVQEREDLEQQIKSLSGVAETDSQPEGTTFDQPIDSFQTKRKRDTKQFEAKRKLEEKIALKKRALKHWENKRDKLRAKVQKTERLLKKAKSFNDDFLKDDFEARWQEKRDVFKDRIKSKPRDVWSEKRDIKNAVNSSKIKKSILKKAAGALETKPKVKKVKEQWETLRDKSKEAQKLKAKGDKKWDDIQKKSMVDSFDVFPEEAKNGLKQFEDDLKKAAQKQKDNFEEKQQKLKEKLKGAKAKESLTNRKQKEQEETRREEQAEKKRERDRSERQAQRQEDKKQERDRAQKREQRREERKNRKKDKYA